MFEIDANLGVSTNIDNTKNIIRFDKNDLSYNDFFKEFMSQNKCCIVQNITESWGASNSWITGGDINFNYLRTQYGSFSVNVYNCCEREFNSQKSYDTIFSNYLDYFESSCHGAESCDKLDYLKNWHLQLKTDNNFYNVPIYFASDWLNEYYIECLNDDYRFIYMGPKNTW